MHAAKLEETASTLKKERDAKTSQEIEKTETPPMTGKPRLEFRRRGLEPDWQQAFQEPLTNVNVDNDALLPHRSVGLLTPRRSPSQGLS